MRQFLRIAGTFFLGAGLLLLVWAFVVWRWQDPFTALYTAAQQKALAASLDKRLTAYKPLPLPRPAPRAKRRDGTASLAAEKRRVAVEAKRYRKSLEVGEPLGRLKVPRLGLSTVIVVGTDTKTLTRGPGWYTGTFVPGEGELIYVAGHRTTYAAPFAEIESLRPGDRVTIELPYGTFLYEVYTHAIVAGDDLSRLRSEGREVVALQACHPRFFATQRYIAYARPVRVIPKVGRSFSLRPAKTALSAKA